MDEVLLHRGDDPSGAGEAPGTDKRSNQFISALSHEIRDPLAVILAGLSMLEMAGGPEPISGAQNPAGKRHKILLIEDNTDLTEVLCDIFGVLGHQVNVVHNGTEGVAAAKKYRPDVIFCDIGIPGLSGYEVAKILKADEELKETFLIALTGYVGEYYARQAKESGFDRYLAKPVDKAALEKILAEIG